MMIGTLKSSDQRHYFCVFATIKINSSSSGIIKLTTQEDHGLG